jgi:hypothetical protein
MWTRDEGKWSASRSGYLTSGEQIRIEPVCTLWTSGKHVPPAENRDHDSAVGQAVACLMYGLRRRRVVCNYWHLVATTAQQLHCSGKVKAPSAHFYHNRPFKGDILSNVEVFSTFSFITFELYIGHHFKHYLFKCLKLYHLRMTGWVRNLWMLPSTYCFVLFTSIR